MLLAPIISSVDGDDDEVLLLEEFFFLSLPSLFNSVIFRRISSSLVLDDICNGKDLDVVIAGVEKA